MNSFASRSLPGRRGSSQPALSAPRTSAVCLLAAGLLAGFVASETSAQSTTVDATSPGGSVYIYSNGATVSNLSVSPPPQPSVSPLNAGPTAESLGPGGQPASVFDPVWETSPRSRDPIFGPFFLPALLPVLGATGSSNQAFLAANYPRESAGEPFFMAYGNLVANRRLSDQRAERITRYRANCAILLTELREQLDPGSGAAAATRERALTGLAAAQADRLLALEAEAERIRHNLASVEAFKAVADDIGKLVTANDWPQLRAPRAELRQLLSAAHFQDGFSPEQRRLLEEMAQEIRLTIEPEWSGPRTPVAFFWPAGARIPMPANLSPEAAARFDEFLQRKAALKDELRAALAREESHLFNLDHTETRERLAAAQAPRFAELDALADRIRPALAADILTARRAREDLSRQRDYAAAILSPGLSPAQRRLLLAAAAADSVQKNPPLALR